MGGVRIANSIAATCGDSISFLLDRESTGKDAAMQPAELWEFLEKITKASLVRTRAWLTEQMLTAGQGADESLEAYVDRLQHMESELCGSCNEADVDRLRVELSMKLVNSLHDDY